MKIRVIAAFAVALFAFVSTSPAQAKRHHHKNQYTTGYSLKHGVKKQRRYAAPAFRAGSDACTYDNSGRVLCSGPPARTSSSPDANGNYAARETGRSTRIISYDDGRVVSHPSGCPGRAFCGCGACSELGISAAECKRRGLFLAANWLPFPSASPGPGMAAARRGHVMVIREYLGGNMARVYDANSGGHQTRVHVRSLAGYRVVNPHGAVVASR